MALPNPQSGVPRSSTSDLANWRNIYLSPLDDAARNWYWQNALRSQQVQQAINNMPYIFDPSKFIGQTTNQMKQAILPTQPAIANIFGTPSSNGFPAPPAQQSAAGLLQSLTQNGSPLLSLLGGNRG